MCAANGLVLITIFVLLDTYTLIGTRGIFSWGWVGECMGIYTFQFVFYCHFHFVTGNPGGRKLSGF